MPDMLPTVTALLGKRKEIPSTGYHIYQLNDPRDGKARYVGCSRNPWKRSKDHWSQRSSHPSLQGWLLELEKEGVRPVLEVVLFDVSPLLEAHWMDVLVESGHPIQNRMRPPEWKKHDPGWRPSNWHTKKAWAKKYPEKAREQRYRHRRKKPEMYRKQMREYMRKWRAKKKVERELTEVGC